MLTLIDNITIVLCVVGIFAISVFMSKKNTDMEAYGGTVRLSGRRSA